MSPSSCKNSSRGSFIGSSHRLLGLPHDCPIPLSAKRAALVHLRLPQPRRKIRLMRKGLTPKDMGDLLELPLLAVLATYRRDGTVLLSPVWHEWREGGFHVVTGSRDGKAGHLRRDPRASIVVCDDGPPYRGIEIRATARLSRLEDGSVVSRIAARYLGQEAGERYAETAGDDLLICLEPGDLRAWDFADYFP